VLVSDSSVSGTDRVDHHALIAGCSESLGAAGCEGLDIGQLTLDDGQLCPAELEQALQGDSLLLMACSAGYYQLAQVRSMYYQYCVCAVVDNSR